MVGTSATASSSSRQARGPNWDPGEDKFLARAWIAVSTNATVGTDQKVEVFWEKVTKHYNTIRPRSHSKYERNQSSVMKRWKLLRNAVGKFCGCFASTTQLNQSGKTPEDQVEDATTLYGKLYGESFEHVSAWRELRDAPKWKDLQRVSNARIGNRKRSTSNAEHGPPSIQAEGVGTEKPAHPPGAKVAKQEKLQHVSSQRLADAAVAMSKTSDKKAEIAAEKLNLLKERKENRILFQSIDGLDPISLRILEFNKQRILRRLESEASGDGESEDPNVESCVDQVV